MEEDISIQTEILYNDLIPVVLKSHGARIVITFLAFSIYCIIRLVFKGNSNDTAYLSYTDILIGSCAFLLLSYVYPYIAFRSSLGKLSMKRIGLGITEEWLYWGCFSVWLFFGYCILITGFWSLHDFKYGFSLYPIIKVFIFGLGGIYGFWSFCHLINIARMAAENKSPSEIITYVIKYAQTKGIKNRYTQN